MRHIGRGFAGAYERVQHLPMKFPIVLGILLLAGCRPPETALSMPDLALSTVSPRESFDPVAYLESVRVIRGPLVLGEDDKIIIASMIYDAYHYRADGSNYTLSGTCDLIRLVDVNFMPSNASLPRVEGRVPLYDAMAATSSALKRNASLK